jgi:hypothetical protein
MEFLIIGHYMASAVETVSLKVIFTILKTFNLSRNWDYLLLVNPTVYVLSPENGGRVSP